VQLQLITHQETALHEYSILADVSGVVLFSSPDYNLCKQVLGRKKFSSSLALSYMLVSYRLLPYNLPSGFDFYFLEEHMN
jgi:hypothetical protein